VSYDPANLFQPGGIRVLAADYPFLDVMWSMIVFFSFFIWIWLLITVFADLFKRHDTSGFAKVLWMIFVIVLPFLGVFLYIIAEHDGMAERAQKQAQAQQASFDSYVQSVAAKGDPTEQIANAKTLLDNGTITQAEFDQIKAKALA
jgi:hypothetical protein